MKLKRFLLCGAPGDVICGIGSAMLSPWWTPKARFIYIGYSESVAEFVRAQGFCKTCDSVILGADAYKAAEFALTRLLPPEQACSNYLETMGLSRDDIYLTHIGEQAKRDYRIYRWKNPQLPRLCREWSQERFIDDGKRS